MNLADYLKDGKIPVNNNGTVKSMIIAVVNKHGKSTLLTRKDIQKLLKSEYNKDIENIQEIKNYCDKLIKSKEIAFDWNKSNKTHWHYYSMKMATKELKDNMTEQLKKL